MVGYTVSSRTNMRQLSSLGTWDIIFGFLGIERSLAQLCTPAPSTESAQPRKIESS